MAVLPFPEYRPDVSDLNQGFTSRLRNVIPRADGYGPFKDLQAFSEALPAACRGFFAARRAAGTVAIFAGTSTKLYLMNNTNFEWDDVSLGAGTYTTLDDGANWTFAQFGDLVIASQKNAVMQVFDLTSSSVFANLAGSPPQAGWVSVVGPFLVCGDIQGEPYRVQWSAINDVTGWTAGTDRSDFQDLPDLGRVRSIIEMGADVGLIFQEEGCRRMVYQPGSAVIFRIDRLPDAPGVLSPYSVVSTMGGAYYFSTKGFVRIDPAGQFTPVGEERVNRTILGQHGAGCEQCILDLAYSDAHPDNVFGAVSPRLSLILWVYKSVDAGDEVFDRGFIYHTTLNRWAPIQITGQFLANTAQPGITLEGLDALIEGGSLTITGAADNGSGLIRITVASTATLTTGDYVTISGVAGTTEANGNWTITVINGTTFDLDGSTFANAYTSGGIVAGSIDDLIASLDTYALSTLPSLAAFTTSNELGFFTGDNLEAILWSAEQSFAPKRMYIDGMWPVSDAPTIYGSTVTRDTLSDTSATTNTEGEMNEDGFIPLLDEGRYVRGRLRIPAAEPWSFATGIEPDAKPGTGL